MDIEIRELERKAVLGDTHAALQLERKRNGLRGFMTERLAPCIVLCPIGTNLLRKQDGKFTYFRGKYVSILFEMGYWEDLPIITTVVNGQIPLRLNDNFFLRNFKKIRRK